MRCLFQEDFGTILSNALVGLTWDRIQWLEEAVIVDEPSKVTSHHQL